MLFVRSAWKVCKGDKSMTCAEFMMMKPPAECTIAEAAAWSRHFFTCLACQQKIEQRDKEMMMRGEKIPEYPPDLLAKIMNDPEAAAVWCPFVICGRKLS